MKKRKNGLLYMLVGVLIGFLIAWSIVWWQGSSSGSWNIFRKAKQYITNLFDSGKENETLITEKKELNNQKKADPLLTKNLKNDSAYYDSTNFDFSNPDALDEFLAMYNGQLPDSSLFDSILKSQQNLDVNDYQNSGSDIRVKKDKLIFAKSYIVPGVDFLFSNNTLLLDSLLNEVPANKSSEGNILLVEFWKSPINYKGYKTGKNKVVVFGFDQFSQVSFKVLDKTLYLKYLSDYYPIDRTLEFKSLNPVNNASLVTQLNNK